MTAADFSQTCRELYLELLKKSLTNTLFQSEPDADHPNQALYVAGFVDHYMKGQAVTMLPSCRLDNVRSCIETVLRDRIPGDLIETGVWRGGGTIYMRGVLKAYGENDRTVWVADSFEGLPEPNAQRFPKEAAFHRGSTMQKHYKRLAASLEDVRANFDAFGMLDEHVRFLKGWFKDTLPGAPIEKLSLMRLDGDYYESTMDALANLYDKLAIGGIVIIDDYGEDAWTNCRQAVEEFRSQRAIRDPLIPVDSKCAWWRRTA